MLIADACAQRSTRTLHDQAVSARSGCCEQARLERFDYPRDQRLDKLCRLFVLPQNNTAVSANCWAEGSGPHCIDRGRRSASADPTDPAHRRNLCADQQISLSALAGGSERSFTAKFIALHERRHGFAPRRDERLHHLPRNISLQFVTAS